jgi:hypothetical protein
MRRTLMLSVAGALALLLFSALLLAASAGRRASVPPGATDVFVEGWRQSHSLACQRISYHLPPGWSLFQQYAYLEAYGLMRDRVADQALRRAQTEWQGSIFAIFVRPSWLGLISERATVAIAPNGHPRPQVSVDRCLRTDPWRAWW